MSESELQSKIVATLRKLGVEPIYQRFGKRTRTKAGTPDILFSWKIRGVAVPVALELKVGKGKLSQEQQTMFSKLRGNGWRTLVIRSVDELIWNLDNNLPQNNGAVPHYETEFSVVATQD